MLGHHLMDRGRVYVVDKLQVGICCCHGHTVKGSLKDPCWDGGEKDDLYHHISFPY